MELAKMPPLARTILSAAVCASAITIAITIACAFMNGGQTTVHINRYGEQYIDLAFAAAALAGAAMILKNEVKLVAKQAMEAK